ncbi:hypothetical protein LXL04_008147 [Taraxacum kok-saghyz]
MTEVKTGAGMAFSVEEEGHRRCCCVMFSGQVYTGAFPFYLKPLQHAILFISDPSSSVDLSPATPVISASSSGFTVLVDFNRCEIDEGDDILQ